MKNRIKILLGVSVILIALLSLQKCSCSKQKDQVKKVVASNNYKLLNPPIAELDIPYQKFEIDPTQPNVLYSKSGAKINIPADAFLDSEGKVIRDKVQISFREFYNPLDFYLAGVPMNYTENGVEKVFESGGMVELNANSNNKELFVNPSNKIDVAISSWTKSKEFNLYDLEKTTGKWIEKGKDSINSTAMNEDDKLLPQMPPLPVVASSSSFNIIDETKNFPEIEEYKNVLFEPIDVSKCKITDAFEMRVKPLKNGIYEVTSIIKYGGLNIENKCECYLAFEPGKDYNRALKVYQKKYAKLLAKRKIISDKLKKERDNYNAILLAYNKQNIKNLDGEEKIIRTLTINNFGFVNCDYPTSYPSGAEINPEYVDENDQPISLNNVVLVDKNTNALFRYTKKVKFNPNTENILWGLTVDNKIAFLKGNDFSTIKNTTEKQKVRMHVSKGNLKTYDDIANVLFNE
jgi:hypothetical protein